MQISFHGAAGDVTGSCHLLEAAGKRILIDCGMFQGSRRLDEENADAFGFDAAGVDIVLLTHAHLDHTGRLPLLVKRGYGGRILTTAASAELAKLVMEDTARLQVEDLQRHHNGQNGHAAAPLYDQSDVEKTAAQMDGTAVYGKPIALAPGINATFHNAGHILGAAWILLEITEAGRTTRLIFSGDLGNPDKPVIYPPEGAAPADVIVMESTYGDRNHRPQAESVAQFRQVVLDTLKRGGNVVIPAFAIERAQDLLYYLREMADEKLLPAGTPVFLDSPMAISTTEIFRRHREGFNPSTAALFDAGRDPFTLPGLQFTRDAQSSKSIQQARGAVILAGSGMCTGGRILHHLQHNLADANNSIVFVGYAAAGTLARQIIDGAPDEKMTVKIYGATVAVKAQVHTISGFSAHAGHDDLLKWALASGKPAQVYLVHGEPPAAQALAQAFAQSGVRAAIPQLGDRVDLAPAPARASAG